MAKESFDNLMLIGRAGSGKSEFTDFLKQVDQNERLNKYHISQFEEIDDFPWIHSIFRDEDLWEELGVPRRLSKKDQKIYTTVDYDIYKFMALKFSLELKKRTNFNDNYYKDKTIIVEYARGRSDGYKSTLEAFDDWLLKRSAIFYLDNTYEESTRRNTVRSSEKIEKQTILHHKCPVEVMEKYYETHDWYDLTDKKPTGFIKIKGISIPFVSVWNIPESHDFKVLEERYSAPLIKLWDLYSKREKV